MIKNKITFINILKKNNRFRKKILIDNNINFK